MHALTRTSLTLILLLSLLFCAACGGGGGGGSSAAAAAGPSAGSAVDPVVGAPAAPVGSGAAVAEAVAELERKGELPVLDRSDSLAGPDANGNGVRDDIDFIINAKPDTPEQKAALRQVSRALSYTLTVDRTDEAALQAVADGSARAINCLFDRYSTAGARQASSEMEKVLVNTRARFRAYTEYNRARSGSVTHFPTGDTCDAE